jgi:hypothetical protein
MEEGSFVFKRDKSNVTIQINRMFLWRLLNSNHLVTKEDFNLCKLRDFVTRIKDPLVLINVIDRKIKFNFNGQEKQFQCDEEKQGELNDNFDQLYYTAMRKYNTEDFIDKMLMTSVKLLHLIRVHF